ncbi:MAG TPA: ABC transporter ATP-binding protein [Gemmatimonadales bacterium]|nr:ABC transporter ATP-binding protein [Gemmatimonadales bacterium]
MPYLNLEDISKTFGGTAAVDRLSLAVERGKIIALLGPSGSGKTTTLRMLGGFEVPDAGRLVVDGEEVTRLSPQRRRFGMVFQHYALFPHLDVRGNVAFGLETLGVRGPELARRVEEALVLVELGGLGARRVDQLSGGQQQRVALARALAPEPRVLLLDEPLSNLDPTLRERTRRELRTLIQRVGITTVFVTHDQEDAFDLADEVAVLRDGRLQQLGTPDVLYSEPANPFVAGFVGRASRMEGVVEESGPDHAWIRIGGDRVKLPGRRSAMPSGRVVIVARPEAWQLAPATGAALTGKVVERRTTGAQAFFTVRLADGSQVEVSGAPRAAAEGHQVGLVPQERGIHLFAAEPR